MQEEKRILCPACGVFNFGVQTQCLKCKAPLPSQVEKAPTPVSLASSVCQTCGAALAPEQKFCTNCGIRR